MPSLRPQDRVSLCRFSFADGRRCLTPRSAGHPHFCFHHAHQETQSVAADELGRDLAYFFSGSYLSACDLSAALARLLTAVARGHIKPRHARTMAYLAQTLAQTIHLSQQEYIQAYGADAWRKTVRNSVSQNSAYVSDSLPTAASQPTATQAQNQPATPASPPKPRNAGAAESLSPWQPVVPKESNPAPTTEPVEEPLPEPVTAQVGGRAPESTMPPSPPPPQNPPARPAPGVPVYWDRARGN